MKKLFGKTVNITEPVLGQVKRKGKIFDIWSNNIIATSSPPKYLINAKLVITDSDDPETISKIKYPLIYGVENIGLLNDGDILLVERSGLINVLYNNKVNDNCLLITNKCNCDCIMCPQAKSDYENTGLNIKIIKMMSKDTKYLGLTGGEPTLLKDDLLKIIAECKKQLPATSIALLTNGILLEDFSYVKEIMAINHPNIIFQIPIYSDIPNIHNIIIARDGFYKTIKGIYNLALFNQKIEIRNVIQRINHRRLAEYANYIYRNFPFVINIALMAIELEGKANINIDDLWVDPADYMEGLEKAVIFLHRASLNVSIYNHQLCLLPRKLWPFAHKSISSWKNIYLDTCKDCGFMDECGGFFQSVDIKQSKCIKPLLKDHVDTCK